MLGKPDNLSLGRGNKRALLVAFAASAAFAGACARPREPIPVVHANDNRVAAGTRVGDTLRLRLSAVRARWYPESGSGPSVVVIALAEESKAPQIPGPMIRVREGTIVDVTVRNALGDSSISVLGLRSRPDDGKDTLRLQPGESKRLLFAAGARGTYFYYAAPGAHRLGGPGDERETAAGAFIVDPPEGAPTDRVFVINIWGDTKDSATYANALAINGRSWPYTERVTATVGDTLRWRVINASARIHPMHLHGFYYTVEGAGDMHRDTSYAPESRRLVVTELFHKGQTRTITLVPEREGNWLFHCHLGFHVVPGAARLVSDSAVDAHATMSADATRHMAGLVVGITISPRRGQPAAARTARTARRLDLFVDEGARRSHAPRALGYVLQRGARAPAPDSLERVGSTLLLTRGEPTDIVVHNRLNDPTAVHWHGIELESYSDGVAGWSGAPGHVAPMIAPADSFVAHLTLRRAGTFIYHTHLGDLEQLTSGLYGAIVVLEPGKAFDAAHDHVFVAGWDGPSDPAFILVNGVAHPQPLVFDAARAHRLRFVGIGVVTGGSYTLRRGAEVAQWRAVAKDGAELPASQATVRPARVDLFTGEAYDFEFTPQRGEYMLTGSFDNSRPAWHQRIVVR